MFLQVTSVEKKNDHHGCEEGYLGIDGEIPSNNLNSITKWSYSSLITGV